MNWENDLMCPHCGTAYRYRDFDPKGKWDFIDGEKHKITCESCKKDFVVGIERPIEVWVGPVN